MPNLSQTSVLFTLARLLPRLAYRRVSTWRCGWHGRPALNVLGHESKPNCFRMLRVGPCVSLHFEIHNTQRDSIPREVIVPLGSRDCTVMQQPFVSLNFHVHFRVAGAQSTLNHRVLLQGIDSLV